MTPPIGAHCGGGIAAALERAAEIGAECLQVFASAPQNWRAPSVKPEAAAAFVAGCAARGVGPVVLHGIYLMNLASTNPEIRRKSIDAAVAHLAAADQLGALGLIIHPGSTVGESYDEAERRVVDGIAEVFQRTADSPAALLLETCAGQGNTIGRTIAELGQIISLLERHPRLGICLDTCHVFAAGYDVREPHGRVRLLEEVDREVGLDRLRIVHANDSKGGLGSNLDRHQNIGHGELGEETFAALLAEPTLAGIPFILEVPGFDKQGPDRPNVDTLRRLRDRVATPFNR